MQIIRLKQHGIILALLLYSITLACQEFKVVSYNIKYDNPADAENNWKDRKVAMAELLHELEPAFIGVQEARRHQLMFLDSSLASFSYIGVARDDGKTKGEYSAILYDTLRSTVLKQGTFWLSETPDVPTMGWDAAFPRVCTYGLFEIKESKEQIWILNTHFDHVGKTARINSSRLILQNLKELNVNEDPVILMGDFNADTEEETIQIITSYLDDAMHLSKNPHSGPHGTFNGFTQDPINWRIDYFFVSHINVLHYEHIDKRLDNNKHISDHLPVSITVRLLPD